jgi:hypothetical protein
MDGANANVMNVKALLRNGAVTVLRTSEPRGGCADGAGAAHTGGRFHRQLFHDGRVLPGVALCSMCFLLHVHVEAH